MWASIFVFGPCPYLSRKQPKMTHAGLTIACHVLDVMLQWGSVWQPCGSALHHCRCTSIHLCLLHKWAPNLPTPSCSLLAPSLVLPSLCFVRLPSPWATRRSSRRHRCSPVSAGSGGRAPRAPHSSTPSLTLASLPPIASVAAARTHAHHGYQAWARPLPAPSPPCALMSRRCCHRLPQLVLPSSWSFFDFLHRCVV
jgi:hypothetical protein